MTNPSLESVRLRFERDALSFDAIYRLERSAWSRWFNTTFRKAVFDRFDITFHEAGDVSGKNVLDIGCGSGVYSVDFARRGAAQVVGVDFSRNMLDLAREEAARHGVAERCRFIEGNFLEIELAKEFDVAIAIGVFDYLEDPLTFLRKIVATTRGRFIATFPGHSLVREPARKLRYRLSGRGTVHFYSAADVQRLADATGVAHTKLIPLTTSGGGIVLVAEV